MIAIPCWSQAVRRTVTTALVSVLFASEAIAAEPATAFPDRFAGDPFTGSVEVTITLPGEEGVARRDWGRGNAQFIDAGGGRLRLVLTGTIEEEGDAGFDINGPYDETDWHSEADGVIFKMTADGAMSGGGEQPTQRFRFDGTASETDFDLTVEITLAEATVNGLPPGTVFLYHYALERDPVGSAESDPAETGSADGDCARVVWQLRNIWTGAGSLTMVRVPVCVN